MGSHTGESADGPQRGRGAGGASAERDEPPAGGGRSSPGDRGGRGGDCCCSGCGDHEGAAGSQREQRALGMGAEYLKPRRSTGEGGLWKLSGDDAPGGAHEASEEEDGSGSGVRIRTSVALHLIVRSGGPSRPSVPGSEGEWTRSGRPRRQQFLDRRGNDRNGFRWQ